MTEAGIRRTSPPELANLPDDFWAEAELVLPQPKQAISFRADRDVLEWFKEQGPRYQTRMNAVLRSYMRHARGNQHRQRTRRSERSSYSHARQNLAKLWDRVEDSREAAVIQRRGHEDMALLPADELSSLQETAYLLRSPQNAARLLSALTRGRRGRGKRRDLATLRRELLGED
ncbi:MAG: type II toxin-antitoxin system prevent-host-death family antitoxin [Gemmatimonadota bacterium]